MSSNVIAKLRFHLIAQAKQFQSEIEKQQKTIDGLRKRIEKLDGSMKKGKRETTSWISTWSHASQLLINTGKLIKFLASQFVRLAMAIPRASLTLAKFFVNTSMALDMIPKMSTELDISTESLQTFEHAAKLSGTTIQILRKGFQRFVRRLGEAKLGYGEGTKALKAMGFAMDDLARMSTEKALVTFMDRLKAMPNVAERSAVAFALFGRQGQEMMNFLLMGSKGIEDVRRKLSDLGVLMDGAIFKNIERFNDNVNDIRIATKGLSNQLVGQLSPAFAEITKRFVEWSRGTKTMENVKQFVRWVHTNAPIAAETISNSFDVVIDQARLLVLLFADIAEFIEKIKGERDFTREFGPTYLNVPGIVEDYKTLSTRLRETAMDIGKLRGSLDGLKPLVEDIFQTAAKNEFWDRLHVNLQKITREFVRSAEAAKLWWKSLSPFLSVTLTKGGLKSYEKGHDKQEKWLINQVVSRNKILFGDSEKRMKKLAKMFESDVFGSFSASATAQASRNTERLTELSRQQLEVLRLINAQFERGVPAGRD